MRKMIDYSSKDAQTPEKIPEFDLISPEFLFFDKYQPTGMTGFSMRYIPPKTIEIDVKFRF